MTNNLYFYYEAIEICTGEEYSNIYLCVQKQYKFKMFMYCAKEIGSLRKRMTNETRKSFDEFHGI